MNLRTPVTRRDCIERIIKIAGGIAFGGSLALAGPRPPSVHGAPRKGAFLVEGVGLKEGYSIQKLTRQVFSAAGGIGHFVSRGDVVVIKPNISWSRAPRLAATTHPAVLEEVVQLCKEAGAKRVRIADNTIHEARRCFAVTGAGIVAKKTGAELVYPRSSLMREMKIGGRRLEVWAVFVPFREADKIINIPVAKHHALSGLTLGMKNWIGAVGGGRYSLHQDIHQSIVDLARFFNPTLTLIDATRVMTRNGPSGGSPSDVALKNTLILSNDPVAADARAARLFHVTPQKLGFIRLAEEQGLGTSDTAQLDLRKVTL